VHMEDSVDVVGLRSSDSDHSPRLPMQSQYTFAQGGLAWRNAFG